MNMSFPFWATYLVHYSLLTIDEEEVEEHAASYSVDSYRLVRRKRKQGSKQNGGGGRSGREFCRCKRGPVGYPGSPGTLKRKRNLISFFDKYEIHSL